MIANLLECPLQALCLGVGYFSLIFVIEFIRIGREFYLRLTAVAGKSNTQRNPM
jgi:hypothetical protein